MSEEAAKGQASDVRLSGAASVNNAVRTGLSSRLQVSEPIGLVIVLAVGGVLLMARLHNGWVPHDEGVLGQSAERVLLGEIPHRDFDEIYTGLLSYLHAASFRMLGVGSQSMRLCLFIAALLWQFAFYRIALRAMAPLAAAVVTLVAMLWAVPNYPASMPSWYNLFCATWGLLALLRWVEDGRVRWLVLAGLAGGVSFLFKLTGVFFVAGGAIAIAAVTASRSSNEPRAASLRYANTVVTAAYAIVALVLSMVMFRTGASWTARFALPIALICAALIVHEWRVSGGSGLRRLLDLGHAGGLFLTGAAIPVAAFFLWFTANGALYPLVEGVFVVPFRRVAFAQYPPPSPAALLAALPVTWLLWPRLEPGSRKWLVVGLITTLVAGLLVYLAGGSPRAYEVAWWSAWSLSLPVALAGAGLAALTRQGQRLLPQLSTRQRDTLIVVCVIAVFTMLVEYPFAAAIYTLYALPLSMLAVAMLIRAAGRTPAVLQYVVLAFLVVFSAVRLLPNELGTLGREYLPRENVALLEVPRGRLWMRPIHAREYANVVALIDEHGRGRTIWAGPDAPEIYFLSGARNASRTMFDFFDAEPASTRLAEHVQEIGAGMVVVNMYPEFSPRISEETLRQLADLYPNAVRTYRFLLMWQ